MMLCSWFNLRTLIIIGQVNFSFSQVLTIMRNTLFIQMTHERKSKSHSICNQLRIWDPAIWVMQSKHKDVMSLEMVPHSKKAWFDELHLSWVQLGEIIATWWEIRAGAILSWGEHSCEHSRSSLHTVCLSSQHCTPLWLNRVKQNRTPTQTP